MNIFRLFQAVQIAEISFAGDEGELGRVGHVLPRESENKNQPTECWVVILSDSRRMLRSAGASGLPRVDTREVEQRKPATYPTLPATVMQGNQAKYMSLHLSKPHIKDPLPSKDCLKFSHLPQKTFIPCINC